MAKKTKSSKKSKKSKSVKRPCVSFKLTDENKDEIAKFCADRVDTRVTMLKDIHALISTRDELKKKLDIMKSTMVGHPDQVELEAKLDRVKVQHGFKEKQLESTANSYCRLDVLIKLEDNYHNTPRKSSKVRKTMMLHINAVIKRIVEYQSTVDTENATKQANKKYLEMVETLTATASKMWADVKTKVRDDPDFIDASDKIKLNYFREDLKYDEFMNEYPVMTRYMVCMGQYSSKSFKRFLEKVRNTVHPEKCPKGYKEDQWVRRQADYVQYLWEAYQRNHINSAERKLVWKDAYKNLKGEFDDFRDKYKAVQKATDEEKDHFKAMNARDLIKRLAGGQQSLSKEAMIILIEKLKDKVCKSNYRKTMKQLVSSTPLIEPLFVTRGRGAEEIDEANKPRIIMTEHVAEDTLDDIPEAFIRGVDADTVDAHIANHK